ncbi:PRD domain-containing protein [Companilactobacillus suantsaicola]|uniref:PRD domain-containing protein n=1 Tax=Companilactobacillus suantsaicola TaxID=2487723 RepID=A0A4Z0JL53_9LACO|nr:PRD domain-containing protein [Companilactobacillus suantsaicola]TGD23651.1 PRD domain-containing protein [Companilactobacillus suantsaicola]
MDPLAKKIVLYLSNNVGYIKSADLAKKLGVSTKTIYRTVKKINSDKEIITSQRGLGYAINLVQDSDITDNFDDINENKKRTYAIGVYVLFNQPVGPKFFNTADKFYLSESALNKEIQKINSILTKFKIKITRKNGHLTVVGNEIGIRQALNFLLIRKGAVSEGFTSVSEIFPSIDENDRSFLITQLTLIQDELNVVLVDPYTLNIFSHLYILMGRIRSAAHTNQPKEIDESDVKYDQFYETARLIIENISRYTNRTINASEIIYLSQYLLSLRYMHSNDIQQINNAAPTTKFDKPVLDFATNIIDNYPFKKPINKQNLLTDLCAHIKPMLNRLKSSLVVVNPLVEEIKDSYSKEFLQTREIVDNYTSKKYKMNLSDDEVSFITLYVVKAIEESAKTNKVLLMCTTGIGTAQLLRTKLLNAIPNMNITDVISSYSYRENMEKYNQEADLIISTVAIPEQSKVPIVVVSPLLNELDLQRVKSFLNV